MWLLTEACRSSHAPPHAAHVEQDINTVVVRVAHALGFRLPDLVVRLVGD